MGNRGIHGRRADKGLLGVALLGLVAAIGLAMSFPAHAAPGMSDAEKLRRLDIMLMVTGLRCRKTADNFTADYNRFTATHLTTLNAAAAELRADLAKRHGKGASKALDRMSVVMANDYGLGHPWLGCRELKEVTRDLVREKNRAKLVDVAGQLLEREPSPRFAYARR